MKKIVVVLAMLAVLIPAAAWAGEYFSQAEKQKICQTAARVLPGVKITYTNTSIGGAGILISPLPNGKDLFIHINAGDEIFIYQAPAEYDQAVYKILKTVCSIIDSRPASMTLRGNSLK